MEEHKTDIIFESLLEEVSSEEPSICEWAPLGNVEEKKLKLSDPGSGEICAKYIPMSASSVLRHPYFNYPAVLDPGITEALLKPEEKKIYSNDGQQKYLDVCSEMGQCPVKSFYKGLVTNTINLKYYCVDPYGIRPMAMSLSHNRNVTTLDLTDNFLNDDACFHLGEMLTTNSTLNELNLSGCRIGASGAKQLFAGLSLNRGLRSLNLNKNQLGDLGIKSVAEAVESNIDVKEIYLSYNKITGKAAGVLAEAFAVNNKFTRIDLSWNNLYEPVGGTAYLLSKLSENVELLELNLSWNSLSGAPIGTALSTLLKAPKLQVLDLSHNQLADIAILNMTEGLKRANSLITLNLSYNPMTPQDAVTVLQKMHLPSVKVQNIFMDNTSVKGNFLRLLKDIQKMTIRANMRVTYGDVIGGYKTVGPDMRDLVLNRVDYLTTKGKKRVMDIALFAMQLLKNNVKRMESKSFAEAVKEAGARLDSDLIDEIVNAFPVSASGKARVIDISLLVDYVQRKWPDRKLPPTPPPEPEPEPAPVIVPPKPSKKEKNKKGKPK